MHQPEPAPRPSLYYRYEVHEAWVPPRADTSTVPVLIVGAGPAGLVAALMLAQQGVASVVLSEDLQVSAGSRANDPAQFREFIAQALRDL